MFHTEREFHVVPTEDAGTEEFNNFKAQWKKALADNDLLGTRKIIAIKQDGQKRLFYVLKFVSESIAGDQLILLRDDLSVFKASRTFKQYPGGVSTDYELQYLPDPTKAGLKGPSVLATVTKVVNGSLE